MGQSPTSELLSPKAVSRGTLASTYVLYHSQKSMSLISKLERLMSESLGVAQSSVRGVKGVRGLDVLDRR